MSDLTAPTEKFSGATEGAKGAENGLESISVRQKLFLIREIKFTFHYFVSYYIPIIKY